MVAMSAAGSSSSAWIHVAFPAACLASSYLLYASRTQLLTWATDQVARASRAVLPGKAYLSGNFAPVEDELFAEDLVLAEGKLPAGLEGCYVRTGPNPLVKPAAGYHWFDGDGMLHAVRIKGGRASYCNRYVETSRLAQERAAGRALFPKLGDLYGLRGVALMSLNKLAQALGVVSVANGAGTGNTALAFHAGRLLALHEGDLPYAIRVLCSGLVETVGRLKLGGAPLRAFTAHPKIDPVNGDMLFISYRFEANPYVTAGVLDVYGNLVRRWGVELPYPVMMHDMGATQNYIVLMHLPLCFDPELMVKASTVPFVLKKELSSRIGLLRRDAPASEAAEVAWFELPGPGFMAFHVANAWETDKGEVKVYACQQDSINLDLDAVDCSQELARLTEYTLLPASGTASARRLSEVVGDFPVVHPGKATRPCKFAWLATMDPVGSTPSFTGIAKMDLAAKPGKDACASRIAYPAGVFGGEAVFVPRAAADPRAAARAAEDDGFLVVYVYDSTRGADGTSYMNVYDARSMAAKPLASLAMPRRVPYGFHGTWVTEAQLKNQAAWV